MIVAYILYAIGAILVFQLLREEKWNPPTPFGIDLAIAVFWPVIIPIMQIWTFLERKP